MTQPAKLADVFAEFVSKLPRDGSDTAPKFTISQRDLPVLPDRLLCDEISVISRQIFRGNGQIDNVRIEVTPAASTLLGCWILAGHLHRNGGTFVIEIPESRGRIKEIRMQTSERFPGGVEVMAAQFVWFPGCDMASRYRSDTFLGEQGELRVVNGDDEWDVEFSERHSLRGFGRLGGACRVATFFLDFGLATSSVNYDYLKDDNRSEILSIDSCEARVELWDAFDTGLTWREKVQQ